MEQQIFVDPQKVDEIIRKMIQLITDIREREKNMNSFLTQNVPQFWKDSHYKALMEIYEDFSKNIQRKLNEADQIIIPHLKNVKKAAEAYNQSAKK